MRPHRPAPVAAERAQSRPEYGTPPAPVAAESIQANDPLVQSSRLEQGDWWNVFDDPPLTALIDLAYENNPNLRSVGARVLEARAGQAISVGNLLPQSQQAIGSYSRVNSEPEHARDRPTGQDAPSGSISASILQLVLRLQSELGARFMGPHPTEHRVVQRQPGCVGGRLRCGARHTFRRHGFELRPVPGRPAADQDRARQRPDSGRRSGDRGARDFGSARRPGSTSEQARTVFEQTRSTIPGLQILLGQANDTLCTLVGLPPRDLEAELGPGPRAWQLADPEHARLGCGRHPGRPLAPAARCSQRRAARRRPDPRRSASPRPTCIRRSSSTALSAGTQRTSRRHSRPRASWDFSRRASGGTS